MLYECFLRYIIVLSIFRQGYDFDYVLIKQGGKKHVAVEDNI